MTSSQFCDTSSSGSTGFHRVASGHHYLAGTLFCDECEGRLLYSRNRGSKGTEYEYFVCIGKQWGSCSQPYHRLAHVEERVAEEYRRVTLGPALRERIRRGTLDRLKALAGNQSNETSAASERLKTIANHERKLLEAHYADSISPGLFHEDQARLRRERLAAEAVLKRLSADYDIGRNNLEKVLELTGDAHGAYEAGDDTFRRLLNHAVFASLAIRDGEIVDRELREPFSAIETLKAQDEDRLDHLASVLDPDDTWERAPETKDPYALFARRGSKVESMVPPRRIELLLPA